MFIKQILFLKCLMFNALIKIQNKNVKKRNKTTSNIINSIANTKDLKKTPYQC